MYQGDISSKQHQSKIIVVKANIDAMNSYGRYFF
jgi:hypothetical protein